MFLANFGLQEEKHESCVRKEARQTKVSLICKLAKNRVLNEANIEDHQTRETKQASGCNRLLTINL